MDETAPTLPAGRDCGPDFAKLPLWLLRLPGLSFGAKCLYARLTLYAGKDGVCTPSHATLGRELGVSGRRIREIAVELQNCGLLSWRRTQKANSYRMNPLAQFHAPDRKKASGQIGRKLPISSEGNIRPDRKKTSDKKTSLNRGSSKDVSPKEVRDYDCLPQNRKNRDSTAGLALLAPYPSLRKCLKEHLQETDPRQPSMNKVIRIIQATGHAREAEIIEALQNLSERGYGANHIQTYAYFETALGDYFRQKREREDAARPCGYDQGAGRNETRLSREEFDELSDAF